MTQLKKEIIKERFTEIEHDYENAWIKCKDNGLFMIYPIYEEDNGLPTLGELLNGLSKENEQLKHNNKMLSMKMSEVYSKYNLIKKFSEDTNPNEAVKTVLHELMMITKEYR